MALLGFILVLGLKILLGRMVLQPMVQFMVQPVVQFMVQPVVQFMVLGRPLVLGTPLLRLGLVSQSLVP